jgi:hypothetical protein
MEAVRSSETSVHTRTTRRHIPENGIFHSHRRENLKSYTVLIMFIFASSTVGYLMSYRRLNLNDECERRGGSGSDLF